VTSNGALDCSSFEDRIHQILDDRLTITGDELLMSHAAQCAECEKTLNDYDSVDDSIKLLPEEIAQILSQADAKLSERRHAYPSDTRGLAWVTAVAALMFIAFNLLIGPTEPTPSPDLASRSFNEIAPTPSLAIATPSAASQTRKRVTLDTSPFSPNFSFAISLPTIPEVPTWDQIAESLDPLEPVMTYSAKIPAISSVHCSLNATFNLIKKSFTKTPKKKNPDLGFTLDLNMLAAV
jgi:hypothetical protein